MISLMHGSMNKVTSVNPDCGLINYNHDKDNIHSIPER
jgi:hypothetical protein